jgi:capsular polysaccharide biosynthesis protein
MKRILDRLMARQSKLLATLDSPPPSARRVRSTQELQAQSVTDSAVVDEAFAHLAEGRLEAALDLLTPMADDAVDIRVHTTIGRIHMMQGQFDAAHAALGRAERQDPANPKVAHFTAELLRLQGRFAEEIQYRRRIAFATPETTADACLKLLTALVKASAGNRRPPISEVRLALTGLRHAQDATRDDRLQAARLIFGLHGFEKDALSILAADDPPKAGERDVVARWITLRQWSEERQHPLERIADYGEPGRRPLLAKLHEAILLPGFQWLPLDDEGRIAFEGLAASRIRTRHEDARSPLVMAAAHHALFRLPDTIERIEGAAIVLGGNGNYYHDFVEYIGALAVPETMGCGADVRLLVPNPVPAHVAELFELLGIDKSRLLPWSPESPVVVETLWLPTRLAAGGRWFDPLLPHWYRSRLAPHLSRAAPQRRVYVSRARTGRRRVANEEAVMSALKPMGFELIHPETMSVREQVRLFSEAQCIIGSSGAALTNMLFAQPGAHVVVLQNKHLVAGRGDLYFDRLAVACGHTTQTLACTPVRLGPGERAIDADLHVECSELIAALSASSAAT